MTVSLVIVPKKLNPVELVALAYPKFVVIHPFGDGNGRMSRLMMNYVLNRFDYPMFEMEYVDRRSYYTTLERSSVKNNNIIFLQWFMKRYLKTFSDNLFAKSTLLKFSLCLFDKSDIF